MPTTRRRFLASFLALPAIAPQAASAQGAPRLLALTPTCDGEPALTPRQTEGPFFTPRK